MLDSKPSPLRSRQTGSHCCQSKAVHQATGTLTVGEMRDPRFQLDLGRAAAEVAAVRSAPHR